MALHLPGTKGARMRVLLVEDDPEIQDLLTEVLTSERGHDVSAFFTAEEAWDAFRAQPYPLLVLDWMLPGAMDGLELCRRLRHTPEGRDAIVLVMTARTRPADLLAVLDAGADDYITKPADMHLFDIRFTIAERRVDEVNRRIEAERAAQESARLEGVLLAARTAAHEVNNALALPVGFAELLLLNPIVSADPTLRDQITAIRDQAQRASDVLHRLQRVIRLEEAPSGLGPDRPLLDLEKSVGE
jgi:DNA-binding response OmpR family regulator